MTPPLRFHPLAERFFPLLDVDAMAALAEDIDANGQRDPIILFQGQILDGRNRSTAFHQLGMAPATIVVTGTEAEAAALVLSQNLHRRHLTPIQKGFALMDYRAMFKDEAKERQREGGREGGEMAGKGRPKQRVPEKAQEPSPFPSAPEEPPSIPALTTHGGEWVEGVSKASGIHPRQVYKMQNILDHGSPEVSAQAKAEQLSLRKAEQLAMGRAPKDKAPATRKRRGRQSAVSPGPVERPADPDEPFKQLQYWWHLATDTQRTQCVAWTATLEQTHGTTHPLLQVSPRIKTATS